MYCYSGSGMLSNDYDQGVAMANAKKCALLFVSEILIAMTDLQENIETQEEADVFKPDERILYWQEVRDEINKISA